MYAKEYNLKKFSSLDLDGLLAGGYYRMAQKIFTTTFIGFNSMIYDTIWLRFNLKDFHCRSSQLENRFDVTVKSLDLNEEKEELYKKYLKDRPFVGSPSLNYLLFDQSENLNVFNSYELCVYDNSKLIGCGIFDVGIKAAAGIVSFFDPNYKKYSLGKYIIQKKFSACQNIGVDFFYPGYFVPGYKAFDYKLSLSKNGLEYFEAKNNCWKNISLFDRSNTESLQMIVALHSLNVKIALINKPSSLQTYFQFYYEVGSNQNVAFFKYPYYIIISAETIILPILSAHVIVFDTRLNTYKILEVEKLNEHVFIVSKLILTAHQQDVIVRFIGENY